MINLLPVRFKLPVCCCLLSILPLLAVLSLRAQSPRNYVIDSLEKSLKTSPDDIKKAELCMALMVRYLDSYFSAGRKPADSLAFFYATQTCRTLSQQLNIPRGVGYSLVWESYFYFKLPNLTLSNERWHQSLAAYSAGRDLDGVSYAYYMKSLMLPASDSAITILRSLDSSVLDARQTGDKDLEIAALKSIADINLQLGKHAQAIAKLLNVLALQQQGDKYEIYNTTDLLAHAYAISGNHKEALKHALASIAYCYELKDTSNIANFYQRLAHINKDLHNYEQAAFYFRKALPAPPVNDDMAANLLFNISDCLVKQRKYQEAASFLSNAQQKYKFRYAISLVYVNWAWLELYYQSGQYRKAMPHLTAMLKDTSQDIFNVDLKAETFTRAGRLYWLTGEPDKAAWYVRRAWDLAQFKQSWPGLMENSLTLFKLDSARGNAIEAIQHYQQYKNYSDSIQKDIADKQAVELAIKYETEEKKKELTYLTNKSSLQEQSIRQGKTLRNVIIVAGCLVLLLLTLVYSRYRIKQRTNRQLQIKQHEINVQNRILEKLVVEKDWLMKEINHRVKNNLQVVMSLLNTQRGYLKDEAALHAIHESQHRVQAISLIHKKLYLSDQLNTAIDMRSYIAEVTDYLLNSLSVERRISVNLQIQPIALDVADAVPVGLIINEAFTNALKYAFPDGREGTITITIEQLPAGEVVLLISDNGIGLPSHFNWEQSDSLGTSLMRGLAEQLDGHFSYINNHGLTVSIRFTPEKLIQPSFHLGREN